MPADRKTIPPPPALEEVLAYEFDDLLFKFRQDWEVSQAEAEELFTAVKKWLWLMCKRYHDGKAGLEKPEMRFTRSTILLDQMWHQFMLFTPNYHHFTHQFFGFFIGHAPFGRDEVREMEEAKKADPAGERKKLEEVLAKQHAYVSAQLGPETTKLWYEDWDKKYSAEKIQSMRKPLQLPEL